MLKRSVHDGGTRRGSPQTPPGREPRSAASSQSKAPPAGAVPAEALKLQLPRADIVRAAVDVFAEKGADATRVEDLLDAAGVARRTFYKYFRNKDDVLSAVYEMVTRELVALIERHADTSDPTAGIRATLDVYLGFHAANHTILRVLLERAFRSDSPLAPLRLKFRDQLVAALDKVCRGTTGQALDPYVFIALLAGLEGLSLELTSSTPTQENLDRARRVMNGLFDAILREAKALPHGSAPS